MAYAHRAYACVHIYIVPLMRAVRSDNADEGVAGATTVDDEGRVGVLGEQAER